MSIGSIDCIQKLQQGNILRNIQDNRDFVITHLNSISIKLAAIKGAKVSIIPVSNFNLQEWLLVEE